ncbi:hypothetical protein GOODEAATRI_027394, partial [Goodea atripinnis]
TQRWPTGPAPARGYQQLSEIPDSGRESELFSCYLFVSLLRTNLKLLRVLQLLFQFLDLLLEKVPLVFSIHSLLLNTRSKKKAVDTRMRKPFCSKQKS